MKSRIFILGIALILIVFTTACTTPVSINVDNQMRDRSSIDVEKYDNQIDITVKEQPRTLRVYEWGDWGENEKYRNQLALECRDELDFEDVKVINLTRFYDRGTAEKQEGNVLIKHPELDARYIDDIITTKDLTDCRIRGFLDLRVAEYVDGILVENRTETCFPWKYLSDEWVRMDCEPLREINHIIEFRCEPKAQGLDSWETEQFLTDPWQAAKLLTERCFT